MSLDKLYTAFLESNGVCTDTRKLEEGQLFFALSGPNFNGNTFAQAALDKGAALCIVDDAQFFDEEKPMILVDDCLSSLQDLANYHRKSSEIFVIALTGSNGKTTTKELLVACLETKYRVHYTKGNLNNHIGVPLTLLEIRKEHEVAIIEMGANHQGEIALLSKIADPDAGFITNIGLAHIEGFGGQQGILKGKTELYDYLEAKEARIYYNSKDAHIQSVIDRYSNTVAIQEEFDCYEDQLDGLSIRHEENIYKTHLFGSINVFNINAAYSIAQSLDCTSDAMTAAISSYVPTMNRSQIAEWKDRTIILDAYNANPSSMIAALDSFQTISARSKLLVLGDMKELGDASAHFHFEIFEKAVKTNAKYLICIGPEFQKAILQSPTALDGRINSYTTTFEAKDRFVELMESCELAFLKGSRSMMLEKLVEID